MVSQLLKGVWYKSLSGRELAMNSPRDTTRVTLWAGHLLLVPSGGPPGARQRACEPLARCQAEKDPAALKQLAVCRRWQKLNFERKGFCNF